MSTHKTICYGDYVIISSSGLGTPKYYCAESQNEGEIKVISERRDKILGVSGISLSLYPNFQQLIFKVYPKLNYDTFTELSTVTKSDLRYQLLLRRLEADEKINYNLVKTLEGKPVKYGDCVQLCHESSSNFLSVSNEKVKGKNMLKLKLDSGGSPAIQFKIQAGISLKTEG